jgi:hypothetical protein
MVRSMLVAALVSVLLALAATPGAGAASGLNVTLQAPTHTPRVGARWTYAVHATVGGKPVAGRITAQIVDPLGGVHPVEFGTTKKPIVDRPFTAVFRDFVRWTADARGIPLTFRITVRANGTRKVIRYAVTPRS